MAIKIDIRQLDQKKQNPVLIEKITYTKEQSVVFDISISIHSNDTYLAEGTSSFVQEKECSKCLEHFNLSEDIHFRDLYVKHKEDLMTYEDSFDGNIFLVEDSIIDLGKSIEAAYAEAKILVHPCRPSCRGLCDVCGTNLNEMECKCSEENIDPRLEALKNLKL